MLISESAAWEKVMEIVWFELVVLASMLLKDSLFLDKAN
jgi:hypothetical protein